MKVKMLSTLADAHRVALPGQVIEVSTDEAVELLDGGYAVSVEDPVLSLVDEKKAVQNSQ